MSDRLRSGINGVFRSPGKDLALTVRPVYPASSILLYKKRMHALARGDSDSNIFLSGVCSQISLGTPTAA